MVGRVGAMVGCRCKGHGQQLLRLSAGSSSGGHDIINGAGPAQSFAFETFHETTKIAVMCFCDQSRRAKNVISSRKFVSAYCQKRNHDVVMGTVVHTVSGSEHH